MVGRFRFTSTPRIEFGIGRFEALPRLTAAYGRNALLLTGSSSLRKSGYYSKLIDSMADHELNVSEARIEGEPSPDIVDEISGWFNDRKPDVVVAVGRRENGYKRSGDRRLLQPAGRYA